MGLVSTMCTEGIAVVVIDNPPVGTGNAQLRQALFREFAALSDYAELKGVVLRSASRHFYSGSDIREFDGEIAHPSLPELTDLITGLAVPVVAALNGATLGGGLELAMACDARVSADDAKLGLPETQLGILPGAGGTVRLPRLVGVPRAVTMIGGGRTISAAEALECGLVDAVVDADRLHSAAMDFVMQIQKRNALNLIPPASSQAEIDNAIAAVSKRARPNVLRAVKLVVEGVELPALDALAREREVFEELRVGTEARNLRYLFFAKRAAARDLAGELGVHKIRRVGIAGAGTMGRRIARAFVGAGVDTVLYELDSEVLERARSDFAGKADSRHLTLTQEVSELARAELVVDAIFEDMQVKADFFTALEPHVSDATVLASNSSYLDLNTLGSHLDRPERFLGLHFFNPADRNPLLEVVKTDATGPAALAVAAGVARALGKTPFVAGVDDGFVANRVYADYRSQAEYLVEDGASPRAVDEAMRAFGFPLGPFAVADMSGLDIAWARRKRLAPIRDPNQRYVTVADTLCELGRLGKKTGAGWYRYSSENPRGAHDPEVTAIIDRAREAKRIEPRTIGAEEVQRRVVCSMLLAAVGLVDKGIARRASDVDVAMTEGFAFPAWRGGPLRFAASAPSEWLLEGLAEVYHSDPVGFALAEAATRGIIPDAVSRTLDTIR